MRCRGLRQSHGPRGNNAAPCALHGDPDPGDIDGQEVAAVFSGQDAAGLKGFPAPAVEAEDPVGFREDVPALQVGEFAAMGLPGADVASGRGRA